MSVLRAASAIAEVSARHRGEHVLGLAFARVAARDAHALAGRRRIDVEAVLQGKPRDRIGFRRMEGAGAAVVRHAEQRRVGETAAADRARRFQQHAFAARGHDPARRRDAGRAGAYDHDVGAGPRVAGYRFFLLGRAERRARGNGARGGEERSARQFGHGWRRPRHNCAGHCPILICARKPPRQDAPCWVKCAEAMLDAAFKALAQMFSPSFRRILLKSMGIALLLIVVAAIGLHRALVWFTEGGQVWLQSTLGLTTTTPLTVLSWVLSVAAALGIVAGSIFLMPAVSGLMAGFFADEVAEEVERRYYPGDPPGHALPMVPAVWQGVQTALLAVARLSDRDAVAAARGLWRRDLLPRDRVPARPRIFPARRHALPSARRGEETAQGQPEHGVPRRTVRGGVRVDPDPQSGDAAVRHRVHGAHAQAAVGTAVVSRR